MLESDALSQVVCDATMDLDGRSDPKALSQHGEICLLVRFDQSSFKSKPQRWSPTRMLFLTVAEFGRRGGRDGGSL